MTIKADLERIVGTGNVSDDSDLLARYAGDHSFVQPGKPESVVFAADTGQIQRVLRYAGEHAIAVTPRSSGIGFHGAGIPCRGGIVIDLSRMNRILEIDGPDKKVKIEPGVTWPQLLAEAAGHGLLVCPPLLPHPEKSVLTSTLEREPMLIPKGEYADNLLTAEVVLASGELLRTGTAMGRGMLSQKFPESPIPTSTRLFQGAQGTLGILTWANLKAEWLPAADKLFFIPVDRAEDIAEPLYQIQRRMLGNECLALNRMNLAQIIAAQGLGEFEAARESLPAWTILVCLSGYHRHPEGRIAYEEESLIQIANDLGFKLQTSLAGVSASGEQMLKLLRQPEPPDIFWKFHFRGSCHEVFFHTTCERVAEFAQAAEGIAVKHDYPAADIGVYVQPVERARACYLHFGFPCDPLDAGDTERVKRVFLELSQQAIRMGGFFTTPYGPWAEMVYSRAAAYTDTLKVVKRAFDPDNTLNPGKLCF
jgi:FAD/FMN-containing dehydrogenase